MKANYDNTAFNQPKILRPSYNIYMKLLLANTINAQKQPNSALAKMGQKNASLQSR